MLDCFFESLDDGQHKGGITILVSLIDDFWVFLSDELNHVYLLLANCEVQYALSFLSDGGSI